jgi:hypothetical protein
MLQIFLKWDNIFSTIIIHAAVCLKALLMNVNDYDVAVHSPLFDIQIILEILLIPFIFMEFSVRALEMTLWSKLIRRNIYPLY